MIIKNKVNMKKNIVKATIFAIVGVIAGINVFNSQNSIELSDVAMANVEALANDETGTRKCSMAIAWADCYNNSNGQWHSKRVTAVENYDVETGSILVCHHDRVTECPDGTHE